MRNVESGEDVTVATRMESVAIQVNVIDVGSE